MKGREEVERSGSGAPIYRHEPRRKPFELATGDPKIIEAVDRHVARCLGAPEMVLDELVSDLVHVDVHVVPPRRDRDFHTLVTSGMSERAMQTPDEIADRAHAELLLCLPRDWPLTTAAFADERWYWPIRWLKRLARLPHEYDTFLAPGHTIPNGEPPVPFAPDTELCCWLVAPPLLCPPEFRELRFSRETTIRFYAILPLYREEKDLKLERGVDELYDLLDEAGATELIAPRRPNLCRP